MKYEDRMKDMDARMGALVEASPKAVAGIIKVMGENSGDAALTAKTRELITLGIAIAIRCDDCIKYHTRNAKQMGVTEEELIQVIETAVFMGGGPSVAYGSYALDIYRNL